MGTGPGERPPHRGLINSFRSRGASEHCREAEGERERGREIEREIERVGEVEDNDMER